MNIKPCINDSLCGFSYAILYQCRGKRKLQLHVSKKTCMEGFGDGWLAILRPFQQYFNNIRTIGG